MDTWVIVTMASVAAGFLFFGTAYYGFMKKWSTKSIWILCLVAFLLATVIPVIVALSHAATNSM